ncbi:MAG: recombination mediator RecR [Thermodesulfobacteriota bacterium]
MQYYPPTIINAIRNLGKLPGVGEKTAERLALHILRAPETEAYQLAESIRELRGKTRLCALCFAMSDQERCRICGNPSRDAGLLCVVEQPGDMVAIEKSGGYDGLYHILQGALSPMDGIQPEHLRIRELLERVASGQIREVIIATGTGVEGESTAAYLSEQLARHPLKVTRIASGVPIGGDLKYVDQVTIKRAMEKRHAL